MYVVFILSCEVINAQRELYHSAKDLPSENTLPLTIKSVLYSYSITVAEGLQKIAELMHGSESGSER